MKSSVTEIEPILGTSMGGGFYAGRIMIDSQAFALIVAPKAVGQIEGEWIKDYKDVQGTLSFNDGFANTKAMAEAGSELAQRIQALDIDGNTDWYIPSLDELEVIYRNLKPSTTENYCYMRSGINLNAIMPTAPYTPDFPAQTNAELFQAGGAEAFDEAWHWTSTQYASDSGFAWIQSFDDGNQLYNGKANHSRARAVRRLFI